MNKIIAIPLLILVLLSQYKVEASHIRAADIYANYISGNTYEIVLTTYTDLDRVDAVSELDENEVELFINKNSDPERSPRPVTVTRTEKIPLANPAVYKNVYRYRYTAPGSDAFTISWIGINRNYNIKNIGGGQENSGDLNIYLELIVQNDPALINNTPQLTIPPLDNAATNAVYTHNPGGFDLDGDIIVYDLIAPRNIKNIDQSPLEPEDVPGYVLPNDPQFGPGASFTLDRNTGQITWDTPLVPGEYNIAFTITEFRVLPNGGTIVLSKSVRDMQIVVIDNDNKPPVLVLPKDTCILAGTGPGTGLIDVVKAYDPDAGQQIKDIEAQGIFTQLGSLGPKVPVADTLTRELRFFPTCDLIRDAEYQFSFKATDNQPAQFRLSTTDFFKVKIIGESPKNLTTTILPNQDITLNWDSYNCSTPGAVMEIYRVNCDTGFVQREFCKAGVPEDWGFEKIGETAIDVLTFTDNNAKAGTEYCYLIAAKFPAPAEGKSYASDLACASIAVNVPLINNVDVLTTDATKGSVHISWSHYGLIDNTVLTGPYEYRLFRSNDLLGNTFDPTPIFNYFTPTLTDSSFTDTLLNTLDEAYSYKLVFVNNSTIVGESASNSTVRTSSTSSSKTISLSWDSEVVWYYPDSLYQVIYIDSTLTGNFVPIDSIPGGGNNLAVGNLENGREYCFYIETKGTFCADTINDIVISKSNIICDIPDDLIPPCPPRLTLNDNNCDNFQTSSNGLYANTLFWRDQKGNECEDDITKYTVYYRPNRLTDYTSVHEQTKNPNELIEEWRHAGLSSVAACYYLTATDGNNNESAPSNEVCVDNCPYIVFPNVISPNGDSKNDNFIAFPDTRFIESLDIIIANRWGANIYSHENLLVDDIYWDGSTNDGDQATDGVYFYTAIVKYKSVFNEYNTKVYNGWLYLIR